jgi:hypothetical protein
LETVDTGERGPKGWHSVAPAVRPGYFIGIKMSTEGAVLSKIVPTNNLLKIFIENMCRTFGAHLF